MKWALLLLMMWSLPVLGQPVLRYNAKTEFAKDGYLNSKWYYDDSVPDFKFHVISGEKQVWDFSGFKPRVSNEIFHSKFKVSDSDYYGLNLEIFTNPNWYQTTKYRLTDSSLRRLEWDENSFGGAQLRSYLYFPLRYGQYHLSYSSAYYPKSGDTFSIEYDTVSQGYAWGKLITPYKSYPATFLVKWSKRKSYPTWNTKLPPGKIDTQYVENCRTEYKWFRPDDGQFLFSIDSFVERRHGSNYSYTTTDVCATYYSATPEASSDPILLNVYKMLGYNARIDEAAFLAHNGDAPTLCISVKNVLGTEVLPRQCIPKNEEWTTIKFRTADLPAGLYFVNVVGKDRWHYQRLWVNHY